jgi:hypothetical protein
MIDYEKEIETLFTLSKEKDEFEFCCTLLRFSGCEAAGWDSLYETDKLVDEMMKIYDNSENVYTKIRLLLFIYCHITEANDFYCIVANLLRIITGKRYQSDPFWGEIHSSGTTASKPYSKVKRIIEFASEANMPLIGELYKDCLLSEIRNAFFHSDYVLHKDEFHIIKGKGILVDNIIQKSINIKWLAERLGTTINLYLLIIDSWKESLHSYKENKMVKGRLLRNNNYTMVQLLADDNGLCGFTANGHGV